MSETVAYAAIYASLFGSFIVAIGIVVSTVLVRRQLSFNLHLFKRNKALEYSIYSHEHLTNARLNVQSAFGSIYGRLEPIPIEEIHMKAEDEEYIKYDVIDSIMIIIAHWENMALAIDSDVADENVCFEMVATLLDQNVKIFRNFIEERRRENPRAYYHLMSLRRRWEDNLSQVYIEKFDPLIKLKK